MNVFIFFEHITREGVAICDLKNKLEENGFKVWMFSIIFELSKAKFVSIFNRPDIIILPWFVDDVHESIIYTFIKSNPNVKIINLHHEQIGSKSSEKTLIPRTGLTKNGCYHFAWGEYFSNKLLEYGVNQDKIFITGNIRNDASVRTCSIDKNTLANKYGLNPNKRWVLFAENRGWILMHNNPATFEELNKRGMTKKDITNWVDYTKRSLAAFEIEVKKLDDKFFENFEFIYRPHPGTILFDNLGDKVKIISERSIYDWIINCDLFVTCESTSIFEAEMCNKPCVTIDWVDPLPELKMTGVSEYKHINNLNDISIELINDLNNNKSNSKPIYEKYCGKVDGQSVNRVVDSILLIKNINNNISNYDFHGRPFIRNVKQLVYEFVTFIFSKTKILYVLKKPKTAYGESRDIPYIKKNWGK